MLTRLVVLALVVVSVKGAFDLFKSSVTYEPYGTFYKFDNSYSLPSPPNEVLEYFQVNTPLNKDLGNGFMILPENLASIKDSGIDNSKGVVVLVHGYMSKVESNWIPEMASELLKYNDINVICVDWSNGAKATYGQAASNTRLVGAMIGELLRQIHVEFSIDLKNMHVIGHSLGSHIAGYVGTYLGRQLGRISGLDPAGPYFENYDETISLDKNDALFVDTIHSDADAVVQAGFGMGKAIGDVDFYPNGGDNQPGCSKNPLSYIKNMFTLKVTDQIPCSHRRAIQFYQSSINTCEYDAVRCKDDKAFDDSTCENDVSARMGYRININSLPGRYYLRTTAVTPFCQIPSVR